MKCASCHRNLDLTCKQPSPGQAPTHPAETKTQRPNTEARQPHTKCAPLCNQHTRTVSSSFFLLFVLFFCSPPSVLFSISLFGSVFLFSLSFTFYRKSPHGLSVIHSCHWPWVFNVLREAGKISFLDKFQPNKNTQDETNRAHTNQTKRLCETIATELLYFGHRRKPSSPFCFQKRKHGWTLSESAIP